MNPPVRQFVSHGGMKFSAQALLEAGALAILVVLLAAAYFGWRPGAMQLDPDRESVIVVTPGTRTWELGIRPGDRVQALPGDSPEYPRLQIALSDGGQMGFVGREPMTHGGTIVVIAALGVLAGVGYANRERYWPGVGAIAALLSLGFTVPLLGAVVAAPFAAASMYLALRPHNRTALRAIVAAVLASIAWQLAIFVGVGPWTLVTGTLVLLVIVIVAKRTIGGLRRLWHMHSIGSPLVRLTNIIDDVLPGRNNSRLRAVEGERAALADQIHASLLPDIERIISGLDASATPAELDRLRAVREELRSLMSERRLMLLDAFGLVPALEWLVEQYSSGPEIELACAVEPESPRPPREVELSAFRITQQALDNAIRHSGAARIEVLLEQADPEGCVLSVIDNGSGFDARRRAAAERAGHQGLLDMERRSRLIGGTCVIKSNPTAGTEVSFRWNK